MGEHQWYFKRNDPRCVLRVCVCCVFSQSPEGEDSSLLPTLTFFEFVPVLGRAFVLSTHIPPGSRTTVWFTLLHVRTGGREWRSPTHRNKRCDKMRMKEVGREGGSKVYRYPFHRTRPGSATVFPYMPLLNRVVKIHGGCCRQFCIV